MNFLRQVGERAEFRMSRSEWDTLRLFLKLRPTLERRSGLLSKGMEPSSSEAQGDLDAALEEHRRGQAEWLEELLDDAGRCEPTPAGFDVRLTLGEVEGMIQFINRMRLGAWERMGSPDFEAGEQPDPNEENMLCYWVLQSAQSFYSALIHALTGSEDDSDP